MIFYMEVCLHMYMYLYLHLYLYLYSYLTQVAQEELDTMAKLNSRLGYEIKRNELALTNMIKNYDGRKQFAKRLEQVQR